MSYTNSDIELTEAHEKVLLTEVEENEYKYDDGCIYSRIDNEWVNMGRVAQYLQEVSLMEVEEILKILPLEIVRHYSMQVFLNGGESYNL